MQATTKFKDLVKTIEDDEDVDCFSEESDPEIEFQPSKHKNKAKTDFNTDFEFVGSVEEYNKDSWDDIAKYVKRKVKTKTDDKIKRARAAMEESEETTVKQESDNDDDDDDDGDASLSEDELKHDKIRVKEVKKPKKRKLKDEDEEEVELPEDFFEDLDPDTENITSFYQMNLSRPLLKALVEMKFVHPTPIQAATIPVALLGRDVCGCAATGTGKTAAYLLPTLERLLYRPRGASAGGPDETRVLVLVPTRELGVQVYGVARRLAQHTDLSAALAVGGLELRAQERELRRRPDIVVATPGRLIDHLHSTPGFSLHAVEVLILDEADRMLEEQFAEQLGEVVKQCSRQRQTMLFSATLSAAVARLAAVSLSSPVRIRLRTDVPTAQGDQSPDPDAFAAVPALRQEVVRVRNESDRDAAACALVRRACARRCLVFCSTRARVHRLRLQLGLLGARVAELHGALPQPQRLEALRRFAEGGVDVLAATDVAARGLDVPGVRCVVNVDMPSTLERYVHRVGRTARAGRGGLAVSLVGEADRRLLKLVVRQAAAPLKVRLMPPDVVQKYRDRLEKIEPQITQILQEEEEERLLSKAENQANRAHQLLKGEAEADRPWFQSKKQRKAEKERIKQIHKQTQLKTSSATTKNKKKPKKETPEDKAEKELGKVALLQAKLAKKKHKQKRINAVVEEDAAMKKNVKRKRSNFADELCDTSTKKAKFLRYEATSAHKTVGKSVFKGKGRGKGKGKGKGKAFGKPQTKRR